VRSPSAWGGASEADGGAGLTSAQGRFNPRPRPKERLAPTATALFLLKSLKVMSENFSGDCAEKFSREAAK
jgi:hypothetical protein